MSNDTTTNNRPTHRIYSVTKTGDKSAWQEIGAAWPNKDGQGFNLKFKTPPVAAEGVSILMRLATEKTKAA